MHGYQAKAEFKANKFWFKEEAMKNVACVSVIVVIIAIASGCSNSSTNAEAKYTVLYSFQGTLGQGDPVDGALPRSGLLAGPGGVFYGTTNAGGNITGNCASLGQSAGCGTVFELSLSKTGGWTETMIYFFNYTDGALPSYGSLISDTNGNLYGTTWTGGSFESGTAFELSPPSQPGGV